MIRLFEVIILGYIPKKLQAEGSGVFLEVISFQPVCWIGRSDLSVSEDALTIDYW